MKEIMSDSKLAKASSIIDEVMHLANKKSKNLQWVLMKPLMQIKWEQ